MDLLLVCKDASASSLVANLLWAMQARRAGVDAAVLFSSEALAGFNSGTFLWPRELMLQDARLAMADGAKAQDLPIMLRGEGRQLDFHGVFARAQQSGLPMYADPIWTDLLALRGKLPAGIVELDVAAGLKVLQEAKTVIGSL